MLNKYYNLKNFIDKHGLSLIKGFYKKIGCLLNVFFFFSGFFFSQKKHPTRKRFDCLNVIKKRLSLLKEIRIDLTIKLELRI
jgi:hypothetical protein